MRRFVFVKGPTILGHDESLQALATRVGTQCRPRVYRVEMMPWRVEALTVVRGCLVIAPDAGGWIVSYGRYTPAMQEAYPPLSGPAVRALTLLHARSQVVGNVLRRNTADFLVHADLATAEMLATGQRPLTITPLGNTYYYRLKKELP